MYVIATGQQDNRAVYYTGSNTYKGEELWGNIVDACVFDNMEEVCKFISHRHQDTCLIIVNIPEITLTKCLSGHYDIINGDYNTDDAKLYRNYHSVSYITNAR